MNTRKIKYLTNRELLREIHLSKNTFCSFSDPKYHQYDLIVSDIKKINVRTIAQAKRNKAARLAKADHEAAMAEQGTKLPAKDFEISYKKIKKQELIFRVMTFSHIPLAPGRKKTIKNTADLHEKVNFPPFQHWKFDEENNLVCVGKSHWQGDLEQGRFSKSHGKMTERLGLMFIKLCERYGTRGNVRGYCVDTETEALTDQGWLGIDQITEKNQILSFSNGKLKWSKIKSIYRGDYDGLMHKMTLRGFDSLVTPEHKFVTSRGLIKAELLKETDQLILLGDAVEDHRPSVYSDAFVEIVGWVVTEGCYQTGRNNKFGNISIYRNRGEQADRIRQRLTELDYQFSESENKNSNICFRISAESSREIEKIFKEKNLNMEFIMSLTANQRQLLIETMIDGDGWRTNGYKRYCQKDPKHVDLFQALCAISGIRTNSRLVEKLSFGKPVSYYNINLFTTKKNTTRIACVDFHGGKNNGRTHPGRGKEHHPNFPTVPYSGRVWCPETEYGCFVARRNGGVFLTGNTYNDEMQGQAILQLAQIGLQFDESKSDNPFAYYTAAVTNSFVRIINIEKRNQNIRDDILEMNGLNPSWTRQNQNSWKDPKED